MQQGEAEKILISFIFNRYIKEEALFYKPIFSDQNPTPMKIRKKNDEEKELKGDKKKRKINLITSKNLYLVQPIPPTQF